MILKQYYLACLSHASYLVADERTRTAVIVDPQRDVDQYLADAKERGLSIRHVFLTHFHADFVAGHIELTERTGATIHIGSRAQAEFAFEPMRDGESLTIGDVRLSFLETPGHTPEGVSIVVYDLAKDARNPHAVLTGDTLFIGDVGRPDLMASAGVTAAELAGAMYDSLHGKLMKLPDDTLVYPAHGAGSSCGKNLSKDTVSTIGAQRTHNYALRPMSRDAFVEMATRALPDAPAYFAYDATLNRKQRPTLDDSLEDALEPLSLDEMLRLQRDGTLVLDVRDPAEFEPAHLAGSVNIGLGGRFASWVGTLLDPKQSVAIIASAGREREAALRLGRVGFDAVAGYLDGGFDVVRKHADLMRERPELVRAIERWDADAFERAIASRDAPLVLDVRNPGEWNDAHIRGSVLIPLAQLEARTSELPRDKKIAVHCASGYRSSIATSLLERAGFAKATNVVGGMNAWHAASLPAVT